METWEKMNKKGVSNQISKILITIIVFSIGFLMLNLFYVDVVSDYKCTDSLEGGCLNITESKVMANLTIIAEEVFNSTNKEGIERTKELTNKSGAAATGEDETILGGISSILEIFGAFNKFFTKSIQMIAQALYIPRYIWIGIITGVILLITITIIGGFLKASNW